jgi:hypothetical protein
VIGSDHLPLCIVLARSARVHARNAGSSVCEAISPVSDRGGPLGFVREGFAVSDGCEAVLCGIQQGCGCRPEASVGDELVVVARRIGRVENVPNPEGRGVEKECVRRDAAAREMLLPRLSRRAAHLLPEEGAEAVLLGDPMEDRELSRDTVTRIETVGQLFDALLEHEPEVNRGEASGPSVEVPGPQ